MAKNPNKNPDKGFRDELAKASSLKPQQAKKKFTWHKNVSGGEAAPQDMGTTRRMHSGAEVKPSTTNYSSEMAEFLRKRKAKA